MFSRVRNAMELKFKIYDLSKNPKSKMAAAAAITANYEIGHNLKSIQFRDPIFFPRPMFSRVRNAMKLSFAFYDLSNYLKIENGRQNWRF